MPMSERLPEEASSSTMQDAAPSSASSSSTSMSKLKWPRSPKELKALQPVVATYTSLASVGEPAPSLLMSTKKFCQGLLNSHRDSSPHPSGGAILMQGWVLKRSKKLHLWRRRWAMLRLDSSQERLCFATKQRGGRDSESFPLVAVRAVRAVSEEHYGRPHCLYVECVTTASIDGVRSRLVGMQFESDEDRDAWVLSIARTARLSSTVARSPSPSGSRSSPRSTPPWSPDVGRTARSRSSMPALGSRNRSRDAWAPSTSGKASPRERKLSA